MSRAKTRNFLVLCHLWLAGLLAPLFILVATTGGAYLLGQKGEVVETPIDVPAGTVLDPESATVEADIRAIAEANGLDIDFETLRTRPGSITTRPTTRDYVSFSQGDDGTWTGTYNQPNFVYRMIELHKGHGPATFRIYQILAALSLLLVVIGGLVVGFMAPGYRKKTGYSLAGGTAVFVLLAFVL
ncbi:hypothetical protein [Erythrobacter sp. HKB08]|uniref:hypothetical protein n=1 Tax=Erythrobacter sp. HKB08 TaxID=2502843 RepID=UPI0010092EF6|nr:hypothetical protein [Erythrobacter sp. HKB08]